MDLWLLIILFSISLFTSVNGAVTAYDDTIYVDTNTPICINVLSNDNYNTPNITAVSNGTAGGFGFFYNAYGPFFITTTSNMAVIEAENYQQLNFRDFPSYTYTANVSSWELVSYNLYSTLQGVGGLRAWPNNEVDAGTSNAGPTARYNIAFRAAGNYYVNVRGQGCGQCNTAYGSCTACSSSSSDRTLHFLTEEGATDFRSSTVAIKDWVFNTSTWSEFKVNWTISNASVSWPPKLKPIYLAMRDDGAVVDRFILSTSSGSATGGAVGPAATQFVNCQSTDILYFPAKDFSGTDNITYTINDGTGPSSAKVHVYVGVTPPSPSTTPSTSATPSRTPSPSPSSSLSPSSTPSVSPSRTPSISASPSVTPSSSPTATPSPTYAITPPASPSPTPTPSATSSPTPSLSPSPSPSPVPSTSVSSSSFPSTTTSPSNLAASSSVSPSTPSHSSKSKNNTTPVIAGVVVGAAVCVGAALLAVFIVRRKKKSSPGQHPEIELSIRPPAQDPEQPSTTYISVAAESSYYDKHDSNPNLNNNMNNRSSDKVSLSDIKNSWDINFSDIKIIRKLGEGAFGEVWEGKWKGSHVAVKKLLTAGNDAEFLAEAELMRKMRPHPNVVLFIGICSNPLGLVTEYVANGNLLSFLQAGSVTDEMKISITQGIAAGMYYLHQQGVIHRDLAARNILLDKSNNPKVSDFGMSRVAVQESGHTTTTNFGPIRWMAPEALSERMYNVKTDVWSFGVVIYEILTCDLPYHQIDLAQVAIQVAANKVSLLDVVRKEPEKYSKKLVRVMAACVKHRAEDRPDFGQIVDMLE